MVRGNTFYKTNRYNMREPTIKDKELAMAKPFKRVILFMSDNI